MNRHATPLACLAALALAGCTASAPDAPPVVAPPASTAAATPAGTSSGATEPAFPGGRGARIVPGTDACHVDEDCAPAACCHATACVARTSAPACDGAMCTQNCAAGSIDCGGGCLCHEGRCAARIITRPE
jgi:hypothetical protein